MSNQAPSVEQLKSTYQTLAFIHSIITQRTQYFPEEFDQAKNAGIMVTEMANKLAKDINEIEEAAKAQAAQEEAAKLEPVKVEPVKVEPVKVEPAIPKAKSKSKKSLAVVSE